MFELINLDISRMRRGLRFRARFTITGASEKGGLLVLWGSRVDEG